MPWKNVTARDEIIRFVSLVNRVSCSDLWNQAMFGQRGPLDWPDLEGGKWTVRYGLD
jgi:hypothetical protein